MNGDPVSSKDNLEITFFPGDVPANVVAEGRILIICDSLVGGISPDRIVASKPLGSRITCERISHRGGHIDTITNVLP